MFSRLENWLFLKTFCFLFYYCKDNTKIPIYVLKHSVKKINKAKFLSIIKPDDIIKYCISSKDNISYKIIIKNKENKKISEFSYEI